MTTTIRPWPELISLRDWQKRMQAHYHGRVYENFLMVITPGGGKTLGSCTWPTT